MKYTYKDNNWFTLIELLVSITIFSIIMVSIITIFIFSSNLSAKVDINRAMQENIKNAVETIAEDVRKNGIVWVSSTIWWPCIMPTVWATFVEWSKLCTWENDYILSLSDPLSTPIIRSANSSCIDPLTDVVLGCSLFQNNTISSPLTNSFVSFRELNFRISGDNQNYNKVTINFVMQPATKKWVRSDLVKNSKIIFQTTLSERLIQSK